MYSLKDGINDGYLTPFKVKQIATTLDDYIYTADDDVIEGEIEESKRYTETDFNRIIEIREREKKSVGIVREGNTPLRPKKIKIKLADGKERTIQHMMATLFWSPGGKSMSAAQFIERLFGDLPELFQNEDELRMLWSRPNTRRELLDGLAEKG